MTPLLWFLLLLPLGGLLGFSLRYGWWRPAAADTEPRILMYHMVRAPIPGARFNKMRVPPAAFRRQIEWLATNGWTFCYVSELLHPTAKCDPKRVAITFDDGYRDNLLHAHPVLLQFNAKATLYPVVDRRPGFDWSARKNAKHADGELGREEKLTDAEITELLASGLWELGGHGLTHPNLPKLSAAEAGHEIAGCKAALEQTFKVPVPTFCYPFGLFEEREVAQVQKAGFLGAVTVEEGVGGPDPFRLRRIKVSGTEGMFAFRLRLRNGRRN